MVPDFCEALTGYRAWALDEMGFLCSANEKRRWPAYRPMRARCHVAGVAHFDAETGCMLRAPRPGCSCGLYAYKQEKDQTDYGRTVYGQVKLWGRVIEHEHGYRAEFAYPSKLYTADARIAARVARVYGVPCEVRANPVPTNFQPITYISSGVVAYGSTSMMYSPAMMSTSSVNLVPYQTGSSIGSTSPVPDTPKPKKRWWKI